MQTRTFAIAASLAMATMMGGVAAYAFGHDFLRGLFGGDKYAECEGGKAAGEIGGPFELVSETGATVTDADVITRPTLLYFGYTYCPDVCPLDVVRNVEAMDILAERGHDLQTVFISVDWGRDDAKSMDDFTANVHPDLLGLTGSEEQIRAASSAYRTYFNVRDPDDEFYLIDHSTFSYLVLPEEGFVAFFRRELSGEDLADRIACYLEAR